MIQGFKQTEGIDSIVMMSGLVLGPGTYMLNIHTGGKYASVVLEFIVGLMGAGPIVGPSPGSGGTSGTSYPSGNLLSNGDFSQGISGWSTAEAGYSSDPRPYSTGTYQPDASGGYLDLGVYGGYFPAYQDVPVTSINNLLFSFKMKANRWSTYNGGMNGGMMRVWISFLDDGGNQLGSASFYLNPMDTYTSKPTEHWEQMGPAAPTPTEWYYNEADIQDLLNNYLKIDSTRIATIRVGAGIFGTHEDGTYTIGHFDDFFLGYY